MGWLYACPGEDKGEEELGVRESHVNMWTKLQATASSTQIWTNFMQIFTIVWTVQLMFSQSTGRVHCPLITSTELIHKL